MNNITREDIRWWLFLFSILAGVVIWGTRLEGRVSALDESTQDKGSRLREELESDHELLLVINERTIRMEEKLDTVIKSLE